MKIAIATDHRGQEYKNQIIKYFGKDFNFIDCSAQNYEYDDYPDYAFKVGEAVSKGEVDAGILLCGTGIGMSIAANKVKGVRCALVHNEEEAALARAHNNANVLAMGTNNDIELVLNCIKEFLSATPVIEDRHKRRVEKIIKYEDGEYNEL